MTAGELAKAMCAKLKRIVDGYEQSPTGICGTAEEAAALIRKQAAQIVELESYEVLAKSEIAELRAQIAELQAKAQVQYGELIAGDDRRDAERWRFFAGKGDDFMDESFKLIMLAAGSDNYDAIIDSNMAGNTDAIDAATAQTSAHPIPAKSPDCLP